MVEALRQHRDGDRDALRTLAHVHVGHDPRLEDRLLDDEHLEVLCGAAEKMLRALPDEVPAQMGEADQQGR